MNVLLVEPDVLLGKSLRAFLENNQHNVCVKRTAQAALDSLDTNIPDCIILEIQLGLHNGIEFLYEIRSYPEWQEIPVIIYTMNRHVQQDVYADACAQLGVIDVLYKPRTSFPQLQQQITKMVRTA